jgi:hypothetical protein
LVVDTEVGTQDLVVVLEDAEEEVVQVADQELTPVDQVIQVIMDTELMDMHQDQVEAAVPVLLAVLMVVMEKLFQVLNFLELTLAEDLDQVVQADPEAEETLTAVVLMVLEAEAEKI